MTAAGDGKRVGSYSPNFAKWFDNPLVFSNEPYNKKSSHGFSRYNHYSSSRFWKHMYDFLCSTMNAASAAVHAVLAWRLDLEFLLTSVVRSRGAHAHWAVLVWGCCQMPSDHLCHYARLGRTKNAVNISICRLPGAPAVTLIFVSYARINFTYFSLHHSTNTLRTVPS